MPVLISEVTPRVSPRIDSIAGHWRIDAKLGSGTTAYVYAATSMRNGQRAALKVLRTAHADDTTRRRFIREGYVANAVGHPGVVQIFEQGVTDEGALYIAMELLDGESLESMRCRHGGSLPIDRVVDIGCEVLDVMAAAHARRVIHRDLKPANVFLTAGGKLKVLDFGLANILQPDRASSITRPGIMIGTPAFMPPEQARGRREEVGERSDVWALGATLFTLITGRAVHVAASRPGQMLASLTKPAPPLQSVAPQVSRALAEVIDRALAFDRKDRWEDAEAMGKALCAARAAGLEASTPVVTHHEGVTPVATHHEGATPVASVESGLPVLVDECDADDPTRVAGYAAIALLTSPEAHPDVVVKEQPPPNYEPHSLAPAQQTLPPPTEGRAPHALRARRPSWINAFAGVCAALVAGGVTLTALVAAERIRARSDVTASEQASSAPMIDVPVVVDPVPEPPTTAAIIVDPLPTAEPPEEPSAAAAPPERPKPVRVRVAATPPPTTIPTPAPVAAVAAVAAVTAEEGSSPASEGSTSDTPSNAAAPAQTADEVRPAE